MRILSMGLDDPDLVLYVGFYVTIALVAYCALGELWAWWLER